MPLLVAVVRSFNTIDVILQPMWDLGLHSRHFGGRTLTIDCVAGSSPKTSDWVKHFECSSIGAQYLGGTHPLGVNVGSCVMRFLRSPTALSVGECHETARTREPVAYKDDTKKWFPVWCKYSVRPERTKDYLINPEVIPKKFDG
jgi:hypothetical protein